MEAAMKSTLLLSSAFVLALGTGAYSQASSGTQGDTAGTSVGPATGRPDVPPEPPAARFQQPGKEGMQAQGAVPGGTGTSVGPTAGRPDAPPEQPSAKMQQPETQQALAPLDKPQGQGTATGSSQGTTWGSMSGPGHVTTTHELKQALQGQGFSDVRILAESFVVQAMKDGKRVTMMLGPNGLSAYQIVDEGALNEDDDTTGSLAPDGQAGSAQQ